MNFTYLTDLDIFSWEIITILLFAGFFTAVINTFAGSGTVISYSLFIFLGLPVSYANGTVRMGVIIQTLAAWYTFYKKNTLEIKKGLLLSIPITTGAIVGAQMAISIDKELFEKIVGIVMIFLLFIVLYKPEQWIKGKAEVSKKKPKWFHYIIYLLIGFYGGFIHIGVGIFLLAALVLISGYDLMHANALKIFTVFVYSPFALAIFIINGHVDYAIGIITSIGNLAGGIIASYFAVKKGSKFIRWILIFVIIVFASKLLGLLDLII